MPERLGQWVIRFRKAILILAVALLIPSGLGYLHTKVNYDLLTYLPKDIETMQGQDILKEEFGSGAFSVLMTEGMSARDTAAVKEKIMQVDHVKNVIWYDSVLDLSVPMEFLPDDVYDAFNSGDATKQAYGIFQMGGGTLNLYGGTYIYTGDGHITKSGQVIDGSKDEEGNPILDNIEDDDEYDIVADAFDELLDDEEYDALFGDED